MAYELFFEPIRIGLLEIKNRIGMAPMNNTTQMDLLTGAITERTVEYYVERAKGGVGLIVTGVFKVENELEICMDMRTGAMKWPLVTPQSLPILSEMVNRIHAYGAKILIQLSAGPGRVTRRDVVESGVVPVSASDNTCFFSPDTMCRPLETAEVEQIIEKFGAAAELVRLAGADGVEIHGHEGYLLDQFTTAIWNRRDDKYGGDLGGRSWIAKEIREAIAQRTGWDFPVSYRLGVKHHISPKPGSGESRSELGRDIAETLALTKLLIGYGYDALNLDVGAYESAHYAHPPEFWPFGFSLEEIGTVARSATAPVLAAGKLGDPDVAVSAIQSHGIDIVLLGRPLLADPYWPTKVRLDKARIRPCIGCDVGCRPTPNGRPLGCSVNPSAGREREMRMGPARRPGCVGVVGGGIAGMEAARVASERGHRVILFEKTEQLGGQLVAAAIPEFKAQLKQLLKWYCSEMQRLRIEVHLGGQVLVAELRRMAPTAVIWATGSVPSCEPHAYGDFAVPATHALLRNDLIGKSVTVFGAGGTLGAELALCITRRGNTVTLVEENETPFRDVWWGRAAFLKEVLMDESVTLRFGAPRLKEINRCKLNQDLVVFFPSRSPNREAYLKAHAEISAPSYLIGDAMKPRDIHSAVWDAAAIGRLV